ncbi:hypothetical protein C8R44DRAFT_923979 [Mycena epipterygia]|nr:hypothetical protein C8R44DRAFT_923979 [Mycena epipterygia]
MLLSRRREASSSTSGKSENPSSSLNEYLTVVDIRSSSASRPGNNPPIPIIAGPSADTAILTTAVTFSDVAITIAPRGPTYSTRTPPLAYTHDTPSLMPPILAPNPVSPATPPVAVAIQSPPLSPTGNVQVPPVHVETRVRRRARPKRRPADRCATFIRAPTPQGLLAISGLRCSRLNGARKPTRTGNTAREEDSDSQSQNVDLLYIQCPMGRAIYETFAISEVGRSAALHQSCTWQGSHT